jgi:hypothetical protein
MPFFAAIETNNFVLDERVQFITVYIGFGVTIGNEMRVSAAAKTHAISSPDLSSY